MTLPGRPVARVVTVMSWPKLSEEIEDIFIGMGYLPSRR